MKLPNWYDTSSVMVRQEVREGRSFDPDDFAIALDQVVADTAPEDYREPVPFFDRTCFTRALTDHLSLVLRRLAGHTSDTAPVLTLVTQFGGGKTHTLTALYHLAKHAAQAGEFQGVEHLLEKARLPVAPAARVAVFVGNAWDPAPGRETPWIDMARQLAGDDGVAALGSAATTVAPGTETLGRVFQAANGPVLILIDEALNYTNRHRGMAEAFHAFLQNLTVALTGTNNGAAVISLPRSQTEMTEWDLQWQEKITKVVRRVAKDLIVNDEAEVGEVVRRRLFESINDKRCKQVARAFATWCLEHRSKLPPEWTSVDTATTDAKAFELLQERFERCYPFHPATLSVFQRKWQALPQFQQTRGTLAMLAQWVSLAYQSGFKQARAEPLITIGSAPLEVPEFRSVVLGQLGEPRLMTAIETDLAGPHAHARVLDADSKGPLRDIHRRVGTAILFESSGGQVEQAAHLPELRFALGEPEIDTTSVDSAALTLQSRGYYLRRVGTDGFRLHHKPTLRKMASDRRASLDPAAEVRPALEKLVRQEVERAATLKVEPFPGDAAAVPDSPRLTLVLANPAWEWDRQAIGARIAEWSRKRGVADRLYPAALVWLVKKSGSELREAVEWWLAWKRVQADVQEPGFSAELEEADRAEIRGLVEDAQATACDEVWASYRYVVLLDNEEPDGLKVIDLGAGHASRSETLCGRVVSALKTNSLLNEGVGPIWLRNHWPPALSESGAWPLASLRQCFLNGSLTRLLDPDSVLRQRIPEFVENGDFGLASGQKPDGTYQRVWFEEMVATEEIAFEAGVFLLTTEKAKALRGGEVPSPTPPVVPPVGPLDVGGDGAGEQPDTDGEETDETAEVATSTVALKGSIPPELWNRLGTKVIPKLRQSGELTVQIQLTAAVPQTQAAALEAELKQVLEDLGIGGTVGIARTQEPHSG